MLEVADALNAVLQAAAPLRPEPVALTPAVLGRVLAADVESDIDSPPFDKALMDGYAVISTDLADGPAELEVIEEIAAGAVPTKAVSPGQAAALYTGAPLPFGADAVVAKEWCTVRDDGRVWVSEDTVSAGRNVLPRGRELTAGEVALPAGTVLTPAALGLLAAVGRERASCFPAPRVGVVVTGDELVEASARPGPGQIRNTNGPMLVAQAARAGAAPRYLGIGRDDPAALKALIADGLATSDVLILSGGVSAGRYDLVPDVLRELGVEVHFHRVRMKPGKPLLFGTKGDTLVFGLPGNPVSGFVGFELFVRPALRKLSGRPDDAFRTTAAPLAEDFDTANDRPTFHPARLTDEGTGPRVVPVPWFGSADLRSLLAADALLMLPPGEVRLPAGQPVDVILL
ncbi:MAG: gephyrin-like molybdotransferase Glp [Gemmataceae bacterium]